MKVQEVRPGYFRVQRRDKITGERLNFVGTDREKVVAQVRAYESNLNDVAAGIITADEYRRKRARITLGAITVRQAWERYFPGLDVGTARAYDSAWRTRLEEPFAELPCSELTADRLREWVQTELKKGTKKQGTSLKTIANAWQALKSAVRLAIGAGLLEAEPWGKFTVKTPRQKTLKKEICRDIEEVKAVIAECRAHDARMSKREHGKTFPDMTRKMILAFYCGLRNGELGALGWDDLRLRAGIPQILIRYTVVRNWRRENPTWDRPMSPTKQRREELLPLHEEALRALVEQKRALEAVGAYRPDGPIFPGKKDEWRDHPRTIDPLLLRQIVKRALPGVDWKKFTPHSSRHTYATLTLVATKGDLSKTQRLTRHADLRSLEVYLHEAGRTLVSPLPGLGMVGKSVAIASASPVELPEQPQEEPAEAIVLLDLDPAEALGYLQEAQAQGNAEAADLALASPEAARELNEARKEWRRGQIRAAKAKWKGRKIVDFSGIFDRWIESGKSGTHPREVTEAAQRAYDATYQRTLRKGVVGHAKVQRGEKTWEQVARRRLRLRPEERVPSAEVADVQAINGGRLMPPEPGNTIKIPVRWYAQQQARLARRAHLGAWYSLLRIRQANDAPSTSGAPLQLVQNSQ